MKLEYIRVHLRFAQGHWIEGIPPEDRARKIREMIEFAHEYEKQLTTIGKNVECIKAMLEGGAFLKSRTLVPLDDEKERANDKLVRDILNMKGGTKNNFQINRKR